MGRDVDGEFLQAIRQHVARGFHIDPGHAGADNLAAVFVAEYTDAAGQTGSAEVVLTPAE